jgi:orotate phosphoribosyltransferase
MKQKGKGEAAAVSLAGDIFERAYITGRFRLRSGAASAEYFDKYRFESDPHLLRRIAERMASLVPDGTEALAGLEMGGIPVATMLSQATGLPALFIRKKAKEYGTCRFAEGGEVEGRRLLIVEDVVTSGGQIVESVRALARRGAIVSDVVCVIDRESGGADNLRREGLRFYALFTMSALKSAAGIPP